MFPRILFVITSNPQTSPRPAEAIRIAAGVGAWRRAELNLYLRGAAVRVLSECMEALPDEESFRRCLSMVQEWGRPVYVNQGAIELRDLGEPTLPYREITDPELARLVAAATYVLRF